MKRTIKIGGMGCEHCEEALSKELIEIENVDDVKCSYKDGTAILTLSGDVSDDILCDVIENAGYEFLG